MGKHGRVVLFLVVMGLCVVGTLALDDNQKIATREAFKKLLQLQPPSNESLSHRLVKPPRHMLELYKKYTHNGGMKKTTGNTVRSILPTIKGSEMLLFNVTCIGRAEEVHLAQLHLHRRRLRRSSSSSHRGRVLAPPCKVKLYRILSNTGKYRARTVPLASMPVPESIRGGWHSLDITPVLRELLLGGSPTSILQLGVRFEAPRNRAITPEHFLSMDNETAAFVVVFSEDMPENSVNTRIPHEVKQALASIKGDDFYLEKENSASEEPPTESFEDESDFDDFSFDKDDGFDDMEYGGQKKKKKKGKKYMAKSVLDSLDGPSKETEIVKKKTDSLPVGNDLMEENSEEIKLGNLPSANSWLTKETTKKQNKDSKENNIFRKRRMHPKSRYRVRMWKDSDTSEHQPGNKKNKKTNRLPKFNDESSSLKSLEEMVGSLEEDDDIGEFVRRRARSKRNGDSQLQFLNVDDSTFQTIDQRVIFSNPHNIEMDNEGTTDSDELNINSSMKTTVDEKNSLERTRRSIHDNELPDTQFENMEILRTTPEKLLETRATQEANRNTVNVIPYPSPSNRRWRGEGRRRRGRGKKRENKKKGKKPKKGIEHWHHSTEQSKLSDDRHNPIKPITQEALSCHRKKLQVDFAEIGWSNWIISPPEFEAYYCSGRCAYPLTKVVKPTNHATMQSLISALGHHPEVPEPCCVPDKLSSTTLLYFDDNQNVVLRNYLDMSVESCACR